MLVFYSLTWISFLIVLEAVSVPRRPEEVRQVTIQMNGYAPHQVDEYVGTSTASPKGFIVGFEPIAEADRVHHLLLFGCRKPFRKNGFWEGGQTCNSPSHILYAWAKNAPSLFLPRNVGFSVGHEMDPIKFLVLQVHYAFPFNGKILDYSGVKVHFIEEKPLYLASVYLFVSQNSEVGIPPRIQNYNVNMSCEYSSATPIYPFAFRTHTHSMGRVVSAALKNESGWTLIGKSNPQWPQLFNPLKSSIVIKNGDLLAARCVFDSVDQNKTVYMGNMGADEMCNFYMMYYRNADTEDPFPNGGICFRTDDEEMVNREYPSAGLSLLPSRPDLEQKAQNFKEVFGITEGAVLHEDKGHRLGQVSGLAFDPSGNLAIFHRSERKWSQGLFDERQTFLDKTPIKGSTVWILKIENQGKQMNILAKYGRNQFYLPHGIHINNKNEYFTTDVGAQLVTKWKFAKNKLEEVFSLGTKFVPGRDREHFCLPTAVTTSSTDGSIYVSDGYCNSRIIKFAANGKYLAQWGELYDGNSNGFFPVGRATLGFFALPHDITINKEGSRLYVSDRQNARVQIFDSDGAAVAEVNNLPNQTLFRTVYSADYHNGYIYFVPGDTSEKGRIYCAKGDMFNLLYSYEPSGVDLHMSHIIRVSPDGRYIYVGETANDASGKVLQFEIHGKDGNSSYERSNSKNNHLVEGTTSHKRMFFIVLVVVLLIGAAGFLFTRRKSLYRSGPKYSLLDRAGFKPLRMDYPSSGEDDSDEDDMILSQMKTDARF